MATGEQKPESIDLDALGLGPMAKKARTATFAPNWKTVLVADGFVGIVIIALGVLAWFWITYLGWALVALGVVYVFLVARRALQWRWLRQQAGLD